MKGTTAAPGVLFVGFDAMDPQLIQEWAQSGDLPAFQSLMKRGTCGPTINPPGLYVGAVWPSFFTGLSPTRHGRYCFKQIVPGTYNFERFRPENLKYPPFWELLSQAGRRVAVVDVPKSPLATALNGIQLQDWGTHDPEVHQSLSTYPPSLKAEITARYGIEPVGDCNRIDRSAAGIAAFRDNLKKRVQTKTSICRELMAREPWDLFLAVFAESHCIGHQCWTLHDPAHPSHDTEIAKAVGDPLKDVYVALDAALGELMQQAGTEISVFVLASHGMGPHYDATFMLDEILARLDPQPGARKRRVLREFSRYRRAFLRRVLRRPQRPLPSPVGHRRFFSVPNNDVHGGIRVNLAGREPQGKIQPGQEFDAVFAQLRRDLMEIVNLDTGEPVVCDLVRAADLYPQEYLDELPDFFVEWNRSKPISRITSPKIGTIEKKFAGVRTGDHKPQGFFWATGPGIEAGVQSNPVSVTDFAPTVAALLHVEGSDFDGKPIDAASHNFV